MSASAPGLPVKAEAGGGEGAAATPQRGQDASQPGATGNAGHTAAQPSPRPSPHPVVRSAHPGKHLLALACHLLGEQACVSFLEFMHSVLAPSCCLHMPAHLIAL